jgi:hypothetical protein
VHRPLCQTQPELQGCTLSDRDRATVIHEFSDNVRAVETNYKDALIRAEVAELLAKDSEPDFLTSVLATVATATVAGIAAKVVVGLQRAVIERAMVSGHTIKKGVEKISHVAKDKLVARARDTSREVDTKAEVTRYVSWLMDSATESFTALRVNGPMMFRDAELTKLCKAFDPTHYPAELLLQAVKDKLQRFKHSGVSTIGRKHGERELSKDSTPHELPVDGMPWTQSRPQTVPEMAMNAVGIQPTREVVRDTRVAWHVYKSGFPSQLVFEHVDGDDSIWGVLKEHEQKGHRRFGDLDAISGEVEWGNVVPDEFRDVAIARHRQAWGENPPNVFVDDTQWLDPMRIAARKRRHHG